MSIQFVGGRAVANGGSPTDNLPSSPLLSEMRLTDEGCRPSTGHGGHLCSTLPELKSVPTVDFSQKPLIFFPKSYLSDVKSNVLSLANDIGMADSNVSCTLQSQRGDHDMKLSDSLLSNFSRTSVLFVSVSFIILMVISLAWLVFYYVQRFRYAHAKDRLARRLFNAAKKALAKTPAKTLRLGDKELNSDCPVCIEPYHPGDAVRVLICKHIFHKTCVDPWLLQHRTCPMCKMDFLKAFGYANSEESVRDEQFSGRSTDGVISGYPGPIPTTSDFHDPFFPTPVASPSLIQEVLHESDAHGMSIIPMTIYDSSKRTVCPTNVAQEAASTTSADESATASDAAGPQDSHEVRPLSVPLFRMRISPPSTKVCNWELLRSVAASDLCHRTPQQYEPQSATAASQRKPHTSKSATNSLESLKL